LRLTPAFSRPSSYPKSPDYRNLVSKISKFWKNMTVYIQPERFYKDKE
jgi:hypothetical protein